MTLRYWIMVTLRVRRKEQLNQFTKLTGQIHEKVLIYLIGNFLNNHMELVVMTQIFYLTEIRLKLEK